MAATTQLHSLTEPRADRVRNVSGRSRLNTSMGIRIKTAGQGESVDVADPEVRLSIIVLGSWGKTTRDAVRNEEWWERRHAPTQDPSTNTAKYPLPSAPRSVRRALLTLQVNPGSRYIAAVRALKSSRGGAWQEESGLLSAQTVCIFAGSAALLRRDICRGGPSGPSSTTTILG